MSDSKSSRDWALEFMVEEYKSLWAYHRRTLEEREITLNYYFRTVTIPSAALATFFFVRLRQVDSGNNKPTLIFDIGEHAVAAILFVIFLVGTASLLKYNLEAENARDYIRAINRIRGLFRSEFPSIASHLIIDETPPGARALPLRIPFYGAAIIVIINAAIFTSFVQLIRPSNLVWLGGAFFSMAFLQIFVAEMATSFRRHPARNSHTSGA